MLGSARAEALSYSAVKLFSKNSNLYNYVITVPKRYRQMDGQYDRNTALYTKVRRAVKTEIKLKQQNSETKLFYCSFISHVRAA